MKRLFFIKSMVFLLSMIIFGNIAHAAMMDKTEVTIGQFSEFIASTGLVTYAEQHGGMVYEAGWVVKPDWNWRSPCLLYTSPSPRDRTRSRMPSSA